MADDSGDAGVGGDEGSSDGGGSEGFADGLNLVSDIGAVTSQDILQRGRELAVRGVPLQLGQLFDALQRLRAQAKGSTAEIFPQIQGQLSSLRTTLADASSAVSRRLGYAGGGQNTLGRQAALTSAARQYGGLIGQNQQAAFANLLNNLGSFQPTLSGAARSPNVSTREIPADLTNVGRSLSSLTEVARRLTNRPATLPNVSANAGTGPGLGTGSNYEYLFLP